MTHYETGHKVEHEDTGRVGVVTARLSPTMVAVHWHDGDGTTDEHIHDLKYADAHDLAAELIAARLEELRAVLRSESISYGELVELQSLTAYIDRDDVELLEAAGVPEHPDQ